MLDCLTIQVACRVGLFTIQENHRICPQCLVQHVKHATEPKCPMCRGQLVRLEELSLLDERVLWRGAVEGLLEVEPAHLEKALEDAVLIHNEQEALVRVAELGLVQFDTVVKLVEMLCRALDKVEANVLFWGWLVLVDHFTMQSRAGRS